MDNVPLPRVIVYKVTLNVLFRKQLSFSVRVSFSYGRKKEGGNLGRKVRKYVCRVTF